MATIASPNTSHPMGYSFTDDQIDEWVSRAACTHEYSVLKAQRQGESVGHWMIAFLQECHDRSIQVSDNLMINFLQSVVFAIVWRNTPSYIYEATVNNFFDMFIAKLS